MAKRKWYNLHRSGEVVDVYIYDEIGAGFWSEGFTAKDFANDLKAEKDVEQVVVHLNSPGGDVFDGVAIYNTLSKHPARVDIEIEGMALSIASVIAMAGDTVNMAENAMFMIHDPWTIAMGPADDLRKQADVLDKVKESIITSYVRRTEKDADEISALMSAETWMTAKEAEEFGFVDEVTAPASRMAACDLSKFRNVPHWAHERTKETGTPWRYAALKLISK